MSAGNFINIIQSTNYTIHSWQEDRFIGVATCYHCVGCGIGIRQRLALAIRTGVFVGDDDGLDALCFQLLTVKNQVGIRIAEAFLRNDSRI